MIKYNRKKSLKLTDRQRAELYSGVLDRRRYMQLAEELGSNPGAQEELLALEMLQQIDEYAGQRRKKSDSEYENGCDWAIEENWRRIQGRIRREAEVDMLFHSGRFGWLDNVRAFIGEGLGLLVDIFRFKTLSPENPIADPDPKLVKRDYPMTADQRRVLIRIMDEAGYYRDWERRRRRVLHLRNAMGVVLLAALAYGGLLMHQGHEQRMRELAQGWQAEFDEVAKTGGKYRMEGVGEVCVLPGTQLRFETPRHVKLVDGRAWFDIIPKGKGFEVETGKGLVHVTGTSFGVMRDEQNYRLDVIEGKVILENETQKQAVVAGQMALMKSSGVLLEKIGDWGLNKPCWVQSMQNPGYVMPEGVVPYRADNDTALLFHFDEPAGIQSEHNLEDASKVFLVRDSSFNAMNMRTCPFDHVSSETPFDGIQSVEGLGTAITVYGAGHFARPFIAEDPAGRFNPAVDLNDFRIIGGASRVYRSGNAGGKVFDHLFNTEAFTIEAWIRNENGVFSGQEPTIFHLRDRSDTDDAPRFIDFGLTTASDGQHRLMLAYSTGDETSEAFASSEGAFFEAGRWYHVAVEFGAGEWAEGNRIQFYLDGEESLGAPERKGSLLGASIVNAPDVAPFDGEADGVFEVGAAFHYGWNNLNGSIDELRYSNIVRDKFNLRIEPVCVLSAKE